MRAHGSYRICRFALEVAAQDACERAQPAMFQPLNAARQEMARELVLAAPRYECVLKWIDNQTLSPIWPGPAASLRVLREGATDAN